MAIAALLGWHHTAQACLSPFDQAQMLKTEAQIPALIASSGFGGRYFSVEDSDVVVVEIQTRSGPYAVDLLVFQRARGALELRLALPAAIETERRVQVKDNVLNVYQRLRGSDDWSLVAQIPV